MQHCPCLPFNRIFILYIHGHFSGRWSRHQKHAAHDRRSYSAVEVFSEPEKSQAMIKVINTKYKTMFHMPIACGTSAKEAGLAEQIIKAKILEDIAAKEFRSYRIKNNL